DIRDFAAYKEYYAIALGAAPPKTKASVRKTQSSSVTIITPPTAVDTRLSTSTKGKQPAKSSKAKGLYVLFEVAMTDAEQMKLATKRSLQQTRISQASRSGTDEGTGILPGVLDVPTDVLSIHDEEAKDEESFDPIVQTPKNSDDKGNDDASLGMNVGGIDSLFESTPRVDVQASTTVAPLTLTTPTLPPLTIPTISQAPQAPTPPTTAPSTFLQDLLNFGSLFRFDHRLKTLEANFSEIVQTSQFAGAVSSIPRIVERYMDQQMNEAIKILIEKMESNKSIHRSDEQRKLYKALVDAYECEKIILDTYGVTVTLKIRHDDANKDEEPSAGSNRGSKRRREGKEGANVDYSRFGRALTSRVRGSCPTYELMKGSYKSLVELKFFLEEVYKATTDQLDWNNPEGHHYPHNLLKPLPLIPDSRGRRIIPFDHFINNDLEYLRGGTSSLQGKRTNLTVEERFAFNVSLRMFTRSIVIQRRVEDLQLPKEAQPHKAGYVPFRSQA
nr:hypothetical protein [Tanacetum cinerariifolium]